MSSTICFSLDQSKILSSGNRLTIGHNPNFNDPKETRCVCETLMPSKHPSFEKHDPEI